jgi:hypothetical protein
MDIRPERIPVGKCDQSTDEVLACLALADSQLGECCDLPRRPKDLWLPAVFGNLEYSIRVVKCAGQVTASQADPDPKVVNNDL